MNTPAWHEDRMVAFDIESTGVDVFDDRIVTAAVVHLEPGQRPRTLSWVIDPGVDIPEGAAEVHGWTNERLAAYRDHKGNPARKPAEAVYEIAGQVALAMSVGAPLIAFNAAYDLSLLEAECRRHDVDTLAARLAPKGIRGVVDPFVVDKHYSRRKGSRKLVDQAQHYGVILAGAHSAGADALASARLLPRMVEAYPELGRMNLTQLHNAQVAWRREQMDSLRAYFDRKGIDHDGCNGDWPLRLTQSAEVA